MPALATVITIKWITREGFAITNLSIGRLRPYLVSALGVPLVFIVIYGLTWLLGLGQPDWDLSEFSASMAAMGADLSTMPPTSTLLLGVFVSSLFVGPIINGFFAFGEELGWRGYLLPKLMPLGKTRAYLLVGIIVWLAVGLWVARRGEQKEIHPAVQANFRQGN